MELLTGGRIKASTKGVEAPRFATVLSDGDRTTLALAIFVARCEDDGQGGKVIVLDDPISSLDSTRRRATMAVLKRLMERHAQVWVLSHDEYFLHDALDPRATTWLCIRHGAQDATLEPWDPEEHCKSTHWRSVASLEAFRDRRDDAPTSDDAWRKIRPVLEHYLRYRFPKAWNRRDWLRDFFRKARESHEAIPLQPAVIARLEAWCYLTSPGMHGDPQDAGPPPKEEELRAVVTSVLEFIQS